MADGRRVVHRVGVLGGSHRHRLRRVPVGRREGQRGRRHRYVGTAAFGYAYHYVGAGLHVQDHRVGAAVALRRRHRNDGHGHPGGVVVGDGHGHPGDGHGVELVGAAGGVDGVGDGGRVVHRVGVLGRGHRHRLRRAPVGRREGQSGRRHRHVRIVAAHRDHHGGGGLGVQDHRVGGTVALRDAQGSRGHRHPGVVVGDGHGHPGDAHGVVLVGALGGHHRVGDGGHAVHRVGVLGGSHRHGLRRVPVGPGEGQRGLVAGRPRIGVRRHVAAAAFGYVDHHVGGGLKVQPHRVGAAAALVHRQRRFGHRHPGGLVVGDGHGHPGDVHGVELVGAPGGHHRVGDGGRVVHRVGVLGGSHRHRLRRVPVGRGEGQRGLVAGRPRVGVQRHVAAAGPGDADHHVGGGQGVQDHRVGAAAPLGHRQRRFGHRHPGGLVVGDGHGHPGDVHGVELVGAPGGHHRVGDGGRVVHRVGVLGGSHRHRLRRAPVARGEGQGGRRHRHVGTTGLGDADHHVGGGLRVQPHRVGAAAALVHRQRGLGHAHPGGVVVGDGHGHPGDGHVVVLVGAPGGVDGVGDGGRVVHRVGVLGRGHRHRLRRAPVGRREGQGGRRHRYVVTAAFGYVDYHVGGGLHVQDHGVGAAAALGHRQRGFGHRHPGGLVVGDGHGHPGDAHGVVLVGAPGGHHRVGDGRRVVRCVGVLGGPHRHRLRRAPVARGEGQAGRSRRQVVTAAFGDVDHHVGGGLPVQHHGVGAVATLEHRQRGFGQRYPYNFVV